MNVDDEYPHHSSSQDLDFQNLKVISAVGRGAKGVVFAATRNDGDIGEYFALKVISKALIEKKDKAKNNDGGECKRVSFEQHVLRLFDHPLLPRLRGVVETEKIIAYAIDYCPGGNLYSLQKKQTEKMFSADSIRYPVLPFWFQGNSKFEILLFFFLSLSLFFCQFPPSSVMESEIWPMLTNNFNNRPNVF